MTQTDRAGTDDRASGLACRRGVFTVTQEARYRTLREQLRVATQEVEERADGYAFRFAPRPDTLLALAEFIGLEGRCCPFLRFSLVLEPDDGPLWLELTGPEGVNEFLRAEFATGD